MASEAPTPIAYFVEVGITKSQEEVCMHFQTPPTAEEVDAARAAVEKFTKWISRSKMERNKKYKDQVPALFSTSLILPAARRALRSGQVVARIRMGSHTWEVVQVAEAEDVQICRASSE